MSKLSHYRAALYLSILSGVTTFILFGLVFRSRDASTVYFVGAALVIPFRLWLASNFVRGLGAVWETR
jgi:hypothetical protein